MSTNADLITIYWERCWNERRVDRLAEVFAAEYLHGRRVSTPEQHAEIIRDTLASFPALSGAER